MNRAIVLLPALMMAALNCHAQQITASGRAQIPGSESVIYGAEISLPSQGLWQLNKNVAAEGQTHIYLVAPEAAAPQFAGERMARVKREEDINQGRYAVQRLYYTCIEHARKHDGLGPATIQELDKRHAESIEQSINNSPWSQSDHKKIEGPFVFLIPEVKFDFEDDLKQGRVLLSKRVVLAIELRPYIDDGKHWVVYTDGICERVLIDQDLLKKHKLSIRPVVTKEDELQNHEPTAYTYQMLAVCANGAQPQLTVDLHNTVSDQKISFEWNTSSTASVNDGLLVELDKAREGEWLPYLSTLSSPALSVWISRSQGSRANRDFQQTNMRRGSTTSVMGVLGGRAAMQETLQMQVLLGNGKDELRNVDIKTVTGVAVKSHPFEEMLKGKKDVGLELANVVPSDRFFVYLAQPKSMLPMLQEGADFLSQFGGTLAGSHVKYHLKNRYLARLGLDQKWLQAFLDCGAVQECALTAPDLFFVDGTEITIISRLKNPALLTPLLKLAGFQAGSGGSVTEVKNGEGRSVFWMMNSDLLVVSTCKSEAELVAALISAKGEGSLGKSAEFRYMLTQLPLNKRSRALAYFSDPFIRNLVSPATKIAQLRRAKAKVTLQSITGKALLAKLDGVKDISVESLKKLGYLGTRFDYTGYTLKSDFTAVSDEYGTLHSLRTSSDNPVTMVTQEEVGAYNTYMQNYTRFWRQFFDPIAIRLDDTGEKGLAATTFILPLIDSSIYNGLKGVVMSAEDGVPMKTPRFVQKPVLMLSLNLKDQTWQDLTKNLGASATRYSGINAAILDDFGPAVHLAVQDADPVIVMGSGDIMGAAGSTLLQGGSRGSMMAIPFILSMLTRPCTIAVATKDPQRTLLHLRTAASGYGNLIRNSNDLSVSLSQVKGKDSWVYSLNVAGMLKIRLGLEVRDGFLFIQNIPWSRKSLIDGIVESSLNGVRLTVAPEACRMELPGLFAAASEQQSAAAFAGASMLFPLVVSGYSDIKGAQDAHMRLFGYAPEHPAKGIWVWQDGSLSSTIYGSISRKIQPEYQEGDENFGLMQKIKELSVETQFEEDGLRTCVKWQLRYNSG